MLGGIDAILVVPQVTEYRYIDDVLAEILGGGQRPDTRSPAGSSMKTVTAPGWPVAQAVTSSPVAAISGRTRRLLDTAAR